MDKVKIGKNTFVYPMPMVLVGTVVNGKANFMAVGWVSRVNFNPPMIAVALGKYHYTNGGIHKNKSTPWYLIFTCKLVRGMGNTH